MKRTLSRLTESLAEQKSTADGIGEKDNVQGIGWAIGCQLGFHGGVGLLKSLGFDLRIKGSHHILTKEGMEEILNLQPKDGKAKPYQVKQVRKVIVRYKLGDYDDA